MMSTTLLRSELVGHLSYIAQGTGAPVVLIHGVGLQARVWAPQIEALAARNRIFALDMPGHGGTAPLAPGAELADFVTWLASALDVLGLGQVSLAGHSMGALIAAGFAVEYPDRVARVAVLNGVYQRSKEARAAVEARAAAIRGGEMDLHTPLARWFTDRPEDHAARALVAEVLGAVDLRGYATAYTAFARGDMTYAERLGEITAPFLAITGSDDPNSTPAMSQAMAARAQSGRCLVLPGQRHMVNLTAADAVTKALTRWLDEPAHATLSKEAQHAQT